MEIIADILLAAGALGAAFYCFVLGRRLKRFNDLEKGMGGAVAVLSAQVDDLTKTLTAAQASAATSAQTLTNLSQRAEQTAQQLELQMASLHDLPTASPAPVHPNIPAAQSVAEVPDMQSNASQPNTAPTPTVAPPAGQPMFVRRANRGDAA